MGTDRSIYRGTEVMGKCRVNKKVIFWWLVLPVAIVLYTAAWLVPATWWYQPISVVISDVRVGQDPTVSIKRSIKRGFDGQYTVSIWRDPSDGHVACSGSDSLRYRGGLFAPHESPLTQWANDDWCAKLPPGNYYAEGCWTVLRPFYGIVPAKTVCVMSNLFTVRE